MPYKLEKQGDKYCVLNTDTGDNKGCSTTRDMAVKHMRALYAVESGTMKDMGSCDCPVCELVDMGATIIGPATKELEHEREVDKGVVQQAIELVKAAFGSKSEKSVDTDLDNLASSATSVTTFKQADGRTRVLMRVSNIFKDRHGEIITTDAHMNYVEYVEKSSDYPEFWLWHTPGSRWGKADLVDFSNGFLTVSGLADAGKEYVAEALARREDVGVSHGFKTVEPTSEGHINFYRTFEVSPLPRSEAANIWTSYMLAKDLEKGMGLADKHRKFFEDLGIPSTTIEGWDSSNKGLSEILKEAGTQYKDNDAKKEEETPVVSGDTVEVTLADGTKVQVDASAIKQVAPAAPIAAAQPVVATEEKAIVKQGSVTGTTLDDVLAAIKSFGSRLDEIEQKATVPNGTTTDAVATKSEAEAISDAWESAITQGKGFVASKSGEAPADSEKTAQEDWLAELIMGGKH